MEVASSISEARLFKWSDKNMYKTTYNDMSQTKPPTNKNSIIPGYAGYVPHIKASNQFGSRITQMSRESYSDICIPQRQNFYSSTGFNCRGLTARDNTMHASCRFFGCETL